MVTYYNFDKVKFVCGCYNESPLYYMYICKHCLDLRCKSCINHEVDTFFCRNCVENTATAEAKIRKNRCANCYDCPSCGHVLGIRATVIPTQNPDDPTKTVASKMYYLFCTFCRWTTHDINMEDKTTPNGSWIEPKNPYEEKIQEINENYQKLAIRERSEKEKLKFSKKRNYHNILNKFPRLSPCFRKSITLSNPVENHPEIVIPTLEAFENPEEFNVDDYINEAIKVEDICDVFQLHQLPYIQPKYVIDMKPRSHRLSEKRSLRCRKCDHNVSKSDFNPNTIKFRINTNAYYNVPEIKILPPFESFADSEALKDNERKNFDDKMYSYSFPNSLYGRKHDPVIRTDASFDNTSEVILMLTNPMEKKTSILLSQMSIIHEHEVFIKKTKKSVSFIDGNENKSSIDTTASGDSLNKSELESSISIPESTTSETCSESDAAATVSLSEPPISTMKIEFQKVPFFLEQKSEAVSFDPPQSVMGKETVSQDSTWIVFKKFNSIGIRAKYTPLKLSKENLDKVTIESNGERYMPLRACINMTYDFFNKARSILLSPKDTKKVEQENSPVKLTVSVVIDIGYMKIPEKA